MNKTEFALLGSSIDAPDHAAGDSAATKQGTGPSFPPPPCFYWKWCAQRADINKAGRSVCRGCAKTLRGVEYPLRDPSLERLDLIRPATPGLS